MGFEVVCESPLFVATQNKNGVSSPLERGFSAQNILIN